MSFVIAAITKSGAPTGVESVLLHWTPSLRALGDAPRYAVVLLIAYEALLGTILMLTAGRYAALLAAITLALFTLLLVLLMFDPAAPRCGCMGISAQHARELELTLALARNVGLFALCLLAYKWSSPRSTDVHHDALDQPRASRARTNATNGAGA